MCDLEQHLRGKPSQDFVRPEGGNTCEAQCLVHRGCSASRSHHQLGYTECKHLVDCFMNGSPKMLVFLI
jgi:hypothetical protein